MNAAPPKAAPPKAAPPSRAASPIAAGARSFSVSSGKIGGAQRVVEYGPGGIGKSTLAGLAPNPIFIDIEEGTRHLDVPRIGGISNFADLRACLASDVLAPFSTVIIDSATKVEEWAVAHTVATVPHEKGYKISNIESYGFGKGYQHVYDTFLLFLADCDALIRGGKNVILIAHDCTADVPNPVGEDYIRYEPHLQSPKSGKASIRNRVIQWADYVLFLGYDVIAEEGKGKGAGTRTIFTVERPDHIAKSRTSIQPMPFKNPEDGAIWNAIFNGGSK